MSDKNKRRLWLVFFALVFFWGLQAYFFLGKLYANGELFASEKDGKPYVSDFINVYGAGVLCKRNMQAPVKIYDATVQAQLQKELLAPIVPEDPFYNQYPPVMFLIFLPLSLFTMGGAWIAWSLFSLALISAAIIYCVLPYYSSQKARIIVFTAMLASFPTWLSFRLGQTSLLLMPVVMFFFELLKKKRFLLCGLVSSLVLLKLQYLPLIVAIGMARGRLKYLAGFASGALVLTLASLAAVGPDNFMAFPQAILSGESGKSGTGVAPEMMQNLRGLLVLATGKDDSLVHITAALSGIATIFALFVAWYKLDPTSESDYDLLCAITLLFMIATSVHTHSQDYVLMVVALEIIYRLFANGALPAELAAGKAGRLAAALALLFPVLSWPCFLLMPFFQFAKIQPFALYALVMVMLAGYLYLKNRSVSVK